MMPRLRLQFLSAMGLPTLLATTGCPARHASADADASASSSAGPQVGIPVGAVSAGTRLGMQDLDAASPGITDGDPWTTCRPEREGADPTDPAPYPYERCVNNLVISPRTMKFNAAATEEKRRSNPTTCCYVTVHHGAARGRPLRGGGGALVAEPSTRGDWLGAIGQVDFGRLPKERRRARAEHWLREAAAEHASVASFARFSLQLASVGAPPELLAGAHAAALDEIEHARVCYALASAYAGEQKGPAPLDLSAVRLSTPTLAELAVETFLDGCVAETLAAVDAHDNIATETADVIREALSTIADDEERHAELAWRTVAWALRTGGSPVASALHDAVEALRESLAQRNPATVTTLSAIVLPCADALLACRPV